MDGLAVMFPETGAGPLAVAVTGGFTAGLGAWIARRQDRDPDLALGFYLVGVGFLWVAGTDAVFDAEWLAGLYLGASLGLVVVGAYVRRRLFALFGGAGLIIELAHLAHEAFAESLLFPVIVFGLGVGVIAGAVAWQRWVERRRRR